MKIIKKIRITIGFILTLAASVLFYNASDMKTEPEKPFIYAQAYLPFIEQDLKSSEPMCTVGKTNLNIRPMSPYDFDDSREFMKKLYEEDSIRKRDSLFYAMSIPKDIIEEQVKYNIKELQFSIDKENEKYAVANNAKMNKNCMYLAALICFCFGLTLLLNHNN